MATLTKDFKSIYILKKYKIYPKKTFYEKHTHFEEEKYEHNLFLVITCTEQKRLLFQSGSKMVVRR